MNNFDNELLNLVNNLDYVPKLLLHSCCGPCSSYVISFLTNFFDITILYYNPNIEPKAEYEKRKKEQIRLLREIDTVNKLEFMDCDYENEVYRNKVKGFEGEKEGGKRCTICFNLRLEKCANIAFLNGYEYFGTTLTVSPYKNAKLINEIGLNLSNVYQVKWLVSDFKKRDGYKKSIELSKKYDLYRQHYCGCLFSYQMEVENESEFEESK